jgi:hypothetical protein
MPTIRGQLVLPEPLRCFGEVSWPVVRKQAGRARTEPLAYRSRDDDEPRGITLGLFDISEDYTGHGDDRPYVGVAIDEHYYMSIARIDGDCPDDPVVYRIDHEGYNEDLDRVGEPPLSEFLADLVGPEASARRRPDLPCGPLVNTLITRNVEADATVVVLSTRTCRCPRDHVG